MADIDEARMARMRAHGARITKAIEDLAAEVGVTDPLDYLAFITGTMRTEDPETGLTPPFTLRFHEAKANARAAGHTWPELAIAMGEGTERKDWARARARFLDNQARLDEQRGNREVPS